jgi:hypothetical protein
LLYAYVAIPTGFVKFSQQSCDERKGFGIKGCVKQLIFERLWCWWTISKRAAIGECDCTRVASSQSSLLLLKMSWENSPVQQFISKFADERFNIAIFQGMAGSIMQGPVFVVMC